MPDLHRDMEATYDLTRRMGNKSLSKFWCTLLLDIFLLVIFIMVPAGIVKALEPCFTYQGIKIWHSVQKLVKPCRLGRDLPKDCGACHCPHVNVNIGGVVLKRLDSLTNFLRPPFGSQLSRILSHTVHVGVRLKLRTRLTM